MVAGSILLTRMAKVTSVETFEGRAFLVAWFEDVEWKCLHCQIAGSS